MPIDSSDWFQFPEAAAVPSPALVVYRDRMERNLQRMLAIAGSSSKLRPHLKTHKMREVLRRQLALGITQVKCSTIAEAEMAAEMRVPDVLLAYQPVGPNQRRLLELRHLFPQTQFSVICDDAEVARQLSELVCADDEPGVSEAPLGVLVDIDTGQHRTGIPAREAAEELYRLIASLPGLTPGGLHAYDGHISEPDPAARGAVCDEAFAPVTSLRLKLEAAGLPVPRVVAGGSPTFAQHARRTGVECSPGTCVFWDASYAEKFPDLGFVPAALMLTRVVARPGPNRLCLDLGHKAVASEMPHPRVRFLNLPDAHAVVHNEEHLVVETEHAGDFALGACLYGVPWHICPTVALHEMATVIEGTKVVGEWKVAARSRKGRV